MACRRKQAHIINLQYRTWNIQHATVLG